MTFNLVLIARLLTASFADELGPLDDIENRVSRAPRPEDFLSYRRRYYRQLLVGQKHLYSLYTGFTEGGMNTLCLRFQINQVVRKIRSQDDIAEPLAIQAIDLNCLLHQPEDLTAKMDKIAELQQNDFAIVLFSDQSCLSELSRRHREFYDSILRIDPEFFNRYASIFTSGIGAFSDALDVIQQQCGEKPALLITTKNDTCLAEGVYQLNTDSNLWTDLPPLRPTAVETEPAPVSTEHEIGSALTRTQEEEDLQHRIKFTKWLTANFFNLLENPDNWNFLQSINFVSTQEEYRDFEIIMKRLINFMQEFPKGLGKPLLTTYYADFFKQMLDEKEKKPSSSFQVEEMFCKFILNFNDRLSIEDQKNLVARQLASFYVKHSPSIDSEQITNWLDRLTGNLEESKSEVARSFLEHTHYLLTAGRTMNEWTLQDIQNKRGHLFDQLKREEFYEKYGFSLDEIQDEQEANDRRYCQVVVARARQQHYIFFPLRTEEELKKQAIIDRVLDWQNDISYSIANAKLQAILAAWHEYRALLLPERIQEKASHVAYLMFPFTTRYATPTARSCFGTNFAPPWLHTEKALDLSLPLLDTEQALDLQEAFFRAMDTEAEENGFAETMSAKNQLNRLAEKLAEHYQKTDQPLKLAVFDWDDTQYNIKSKKPNIMPAEGWASYYNWLREGDFFPLLMTTRSRGCGELGNINPLLEAMGLDDRIFLGGVVLKAEALNYLRNILVEQGISIDFIHLFDDQEDELMVAEKLEIKSTQAFRDSYNSFEEASESDSVFGELYRFIQRNWARTQPPMSQRCFTSPKSNLENQPSTDRCAYPSPF